MRKKHTWRGIGGVLKDAFDGFIDHKVAKLSGALAYFTIFSLGPMLMVVIFCADIFYGREAIEGNVFGQIQGFVGAPAAAQIQEIIRDATLSGKTTITGLLGFIALLVGATTVFAEIQDTINTIWGLKAKPKKGWLKMLLNRLLSFSIVVSLSFLLLVSLVVTGLAEALSNRLLHLFPNLAIVVVYLFNVLITFGIVTFLFAIIFKLLPDAEITWRDVITGAMVTAILFMAGKFAISFYISTSNVSTAYGTAGSFVIILLWIYYSSIILYFGAEFTKAYAAAYGRIIRPTKYAVWVKQVEMENGTGSLRQQEATKKEENEATGENIKVT
jgi:membrane protein